MMKDTKNPQTLKSVTVCTDISSSRARYSLILHRLQWFSHFVRFISKCVASFFFLSFHCDSQDCLESNVGLTLCLHGLHSSMTAAQQQRLRVLRQCLHWIRLTAALLCFQKRFVHSPIHNEGLRV